MDRDKDSTAPSLSLQRSTVSPRGDEDAATAPQEIENSGSVMYLLCGELSWEWRRFSFDVLIGCVYSKDRAVSG